MNSYKASFVNELHKLFARAKNKWSLALTAIIPVAAAIVISRFQTGFGVAAVISADFPILMLQAFSVLFLPLFIFMAAADMFAGELGDKSLKLTLTRPVSRFKVFASKLAALIVFTGVFLAAAFVVSTVSGLFFGVKGIC
ncbi:ABC transporter permease [Paenibacillus sp. P26]|nr:ABC transporter permease [Paenibacillus sp. P26]UUZ95623.1 ABC transporter permease [Paenibacillus sp. P25]